MEMLTILGMYNYNQAVFEELHIPEEVDRETLIDNILMECAEFELVYPSWDFMRFAIGKWSLKELPTWERIVRASLADYNPIENYNRTELITDTETEENRASGADSTSSTSSGTSSASGTSSGTDRQVNSGTDTTSASGSENSNSSDSATNKNKQTNSGRDTASETKEQEGTYNKSEINKVNAFDNDLPAVHDITTTEENSENTEDSTGYTEYGHIINEEQTQIGTHKTNNNRQESSSVKHGHIINNELNNEHEEQSNTQGQEQSSINYGKVDNKSRLFEHENHTSGNIGVTTSQQMLEQELEISKKLNIYNYIIDSFQKRFCLLLY